MLMKQLSPRSLKRLKENGASNKQNQQKEQKTYKVVVIGDCEVGKSALTMQYVSNVFLDFHDPTIEDFFQTQTVVDGESGIVDILDTAGQDGSQTTMNEQYLRQGGQAYIGVYSITSLPSYNRLRKQIQTLKRLRANERIPLIIVANKLDLFNDRVVSTMDGIALAREFDCPFYEASAANRINVEDAFNGLIRQVRKMENDIMFECENLKKPKLKRFRKYVCKKIQSHIVI
ncbi:ras-like protein rasD isoform X2 [Clytia hemisphaerica]